MGAQLDLWLPTEAVRWNRALRGAFIKGVIAAKGGVMESDNPYNETGTLHGAGKRSWRGAFRKKWQEGWQWGQFLG